MIRNILGGACLFAALGAGVSDAQAQTTSWFRSDFNNLNQSGTNMYNFANRYAQSSTTWQTTHTTNQGWNGSGAPRVVVHGCSGGTTCNLSQHQFNIGWVTPALGGSRSLGDSAFVRFRIKFDANTPFNNFRSKFILLGSTGVTPNSRWIIHLLDAKDNQGCSPGFESYSYMGWTPPSTIWYQASQWGLPDWDTSAALGKYAGFQSSVNISWSCAPAVLMTSSNHAAPVPKPQARGEAPINGWYHLQFQAVSGAAGTADFRTWANNNNQASPSSERLNMVDGLGVTNWTNGAEVGGYWQTAMPGSVGFIIDDFEIGPTFDPNWYPGGTSVAPQPPSNVQVE